MSTLYAFLLGIIDHIRLSDLGRTWDYDQDKNEAYDRGWNTIDCIMRRN